MSAPVKSAAPLDQYDRRITRLVQVAFIAGLGALWYLATNVWGMSPILLPKPQDAFSELLDILKSGEFWPDLLLTLSELAGAFAISMTLGLAIGFMVSLSPV